MPNTSDHVALEGGEDLVSSGILVQPGRAQLLLNYFVDIDGGYTSEKGYVAFDGSPITLTFSSGSGLETPGSSDSVTIGSVTADVIQVTVSTGTFAGGDAAGTITVGGVRGGKVAAPSAGAALFSRGQTATVSAVSAPAVVPGSGHVTGVWVWRGDVYAIRHNGGTPGVDILYKATPTGWTAVSTGFKVAFTAGGGGAPATTPFRGQVLTQGGVTAVISGVKVTSGAFLSTGNAAGEFFVHTIAGGNFSAGAATYGAGSTPVTLSGAQTANALPGAATFYQFINSNFTANSAGEMMYFVRGGGSAYEYDGDCLVEIYPGMGDNKPTRLVAHGNRLFFAFNGGSIGFSAPGDPTTGFTQTYTSGTISLGEEITDLVSTIGGALIIFGRGRTKVLTGNISGASGDMFVRELNTKIGAVPWTAQGLNDVYFMGEDGGRSLAQTDKFGDFAGSAITSGVAPFAKEISRSATASAVIPSLGQWRVFAAGGARTSFLAATFSGGQYRGSGRGQYGFAMSSVCVGQYGNEEAMFAGARDGFVYRLLHGNSHNGSPFLRGVVLVYNSHGNPALEKQWRRMQLHVDTDSALEFKYQLSFNWGGRGSPKTEVGVGEIPASGGVWGVATWGRFTWGGSGQNAVADLDIFGVGRNFSITIQSKSDHEPVHTIRGYSVIYEPRRYLR